MRVRALLPALALAATACGARTGLETEGESTPEWADVPSECAVEDERLVLTGTLRDLRGDHPDVEQGILGDDRGIVEERLGADGAPVYAGGAGGTLTTHGPDTFESWFHDVPGENLSIPFTVPLAHLGQALGFSSAAFFPLDGEGFGDEGREHNFHFTLHARATFLYQGGEVFDFAGDDDLFAFVDGRLIVDLGGIHATEESSVDLDGLDLVRGERYPLDLFFAERQSTGSTIAIAFRRFRFCAP